MGLKVFRSCSFKESSFLPAKKKMFVVNNEGINILGTVFVRLSDADPKGNTIQTAEMIYVSDSTNLFYLGGRYGKIEDDCTRFSYCLSYCFRI